MSFAFPERAPARPIWLITLADLALLLVGFFVLVQAQTSRHALAEGLRARFGAPVAPAMAMPVAAAGMLDFAPGSATLPGAPAATIAWAREAARDPRVTLTVTGAVDGAPADVDPLTRSGAVLAADRARAMAAALAGAGVAPGRLLVTTAPRPGRRSALVTIGFSGSHP